MFDARNRLLDDMSEKPQNQPDLIERIERALLLLAYFIELDGDVHLPMYAKFEAELEDLKRAQDTRERARMRLAGYAAKLPSVNVLPEQAKHSACPQALADPVFEGEDPAQGTANVAS